MAEKFFFGARLDSFRGRFLLFIGVVLFLLGFLFWGFEKLEQPGVMPIKNVIVKADFQQMTQQQVRSAITPFLNKGFFGVSTNAIQASLLSMPWVATATVTRVWPNKLVVVLTEKKPVATWEGSFLTADGQLFVPPQKVNLPDLTKLQGSDDKKDEIVQYYTQFTQLLAPIGLTMRVLTLSPDDGWSVVLSNGVTLKLGGSNMLARVQLFVKAVPKIFSGQDATAQIVDLRYANGFAVKWETQSHPGVASSISMLSAK